MILPNTDYASIYDQMERDSQKVEYYIQKEQKKASKYFKSLDSLPALYYKVYTVPDSNNTYLLWFYALTEDEANFSTFYWGNALLMNDEKGRRIAISRRLHKQIGIEEPEENLQIYTGHFFSRYRERMNFKMEDELAVIGTFFGRNIAFAFQLDHSKMTLKSEKYKEASSWRIEDGVTMGQDFWVPWKNKKLHVVKNNTFLSRKILKKDQDRIVPTYHDVRNIINTYVSEKDKKDSFLQ